MQAKGFLMGGTAGRTTLAGEGLQHQDGDSLIVANTIPNCVSYDPTYAYELAVILREGMRRMYENMESVFYYITLMNENYIHPAIPKGAEEGIIKGMYPLKVVGESKIEVQLLGSGAILREVEKAADMLAKDWALCLMFGVLLVLMRLQERLKKLIVKIYLVQVKIRRFHT